MTRIPRWANHQAAVQRASVESAAESGLRLAVRRYGLLILATTLIGIGLPADVIWAADSLDAIPPAVSQRIADVLAERRVDASAKWPGGLSRGLRDLFRETVAAVPLVIASDGIGSSVVVHVDRQRDFALLVTNKHVVSSPFADEEKKVQFVILIFYEPILARTVFDRPRVAQCFTGRERSGWCSSLRSVTRVGTLVASDPSRDLALLVISDVPASVKAITLGAIDSVAPGDDVVVIGHPLGLLWSITTGIVSGIRTNFRISESSPTESTVVQTQTPINPGNSGGPLLTADGHLIGVIFGSPTLSASQNPNAEVRVAAPGLNYAIGVNEVRGFFSRSTSNAR